MLGIYSHIGSLSKVEFQEIIKGVSKSNTYDVLENNIGFFSIVYKNFNKKYSIYKNEKNWILIDGYVFNTSGDRLSALEVLNYINNHKFSTDKLNGEFLIISKIDNQIILLNDIMGQRQYNISKIDNNISIAPSPGLTLKLNKQKKELNPKSLITFIATNKLRYKNKSIWKNCEIIEPGIYGILNKNDFQFKKYWSLNHSNKIDKFDVDFFIDIYKKAVNNRIFNKDIGITLTGGLDSRSMAAAIESENLKNLSAHTMGSNNSSESNLAREVAEKLNLPHYVFNINPNDIFNNENLEYFEDEEIDLIIQGLWNPFSKSINNLNYIMHGLDLDVTLGGIYLTEELEKIESQDDYEKYVIVNNLRIPEDELVKLFKPSILDLFNIKKYVIDSASNIEGNNYLEKYDSFIIKNSMGRVILQRYRGIRNNIETISPMYDKQILDYIFSLNISERVNYRAFFPFINKLNSELCSIEYQRTGLPANVPVKYWKESQKIEKHKEELYRIIAHDSNGKNFIPYDRYYTNIDEWMRFNKTWKNQIYDLLQSEKSIIRKKWLNNDYLDEIILNHQNHKKSNFGLIQTLMSAELYLRMEN